MVDNNRIPLRLIDGIKNGFCNDSYWFCTYNVSNSNKVKKYNIF